DEQVLYLIEHIDNNGSSEFKKTKLEAVKFVPLLGGTN
ncbi:MAG: protein-L-isoaspartate O-methyltransferase, partial [Candidatus Methylopumilus sp.]